jgi:signal transduction histidine kinase/CheY-like chemotaxis protein
MNGDIELRTLVLAPIGRDGSISEDLLKKAGLQAQVCTSLDHLITEIRRGVGAVLVAEEALRGGAFCTLQDLIAHQERWSELPFVVLSTNRSQAAVALWRNHMLDALHNVSLLERPVQAITLVSAVRAALRARQRQYEVRAYLEQRQRSAAEMEQLVADRTKALAAANAALLVQLKERAEIEERLRHAQKIEAIGQLTGGIAHDFNNLLMVITAGLNMIEKRPARSAEVIDAMQKAAARGARLTHQLLAFSRRQALKPQAIDLYHYLDEMSELLDRSLRGDVHVETQLADNLWPITADPAELQLVILNLAVNARDAMPNGGTIIIRVENAPGNTADTSQDFVRLSISDSGTGMTPDVMARAFDPFFTTKDIGKGSGLGLAQVHGFVTQSGGTVELTSEVGKGTTITLVLPRSEVMPQQQEPHPVLRRQNGHTHRGRVLLVEDEDEVAALVGQMLNELGYDVTRAASASAALGALANGRAIDLVFSDVMMPGGMNGLELSREIHRRRPDLPVLLTSGYAEAIKNDARAEGVQLLPKPYQLEELAAAIEMLTKDTGHSRALH